MNYPLISEYVEAIMSAEDNFEELSYLKPVLDDDGLPVMTSGNFAVVFKMEDMETGKFYALKCFTKEQEERAEAYHQIADALKDVDSPYLVSLRYLDKELFVDTEQTSETEFPVLLMDWVQGKTLDKYLRENLDDKYALEMLAYRFSLLAQWIIPQPFAHGDLKPDNILVREDGTLVLVDYDGMYVPAMKGQKARELGSPDFRHPKRDEKDFNENSDNFPLISILLSLKALSIGPQWLNEYGAADRLLLSEKDYRNIEKCRVLKNIIPSDNDDLNCIASTFLILLSENNNVKLPIQLYQCNVSLACLMHYFELGEKYKKGIEVIQDGILSVRYYKIAAELGYSKAQYKLGVCYHDGFGVNIDIQEAIHWFRIAANQGCLEALYTIGNINEEMDEPNAFHIYADTVRKVKIAINEQKCNREALGILGVCLLFGHGIQKDESMAYNYLKQSAEKGYDNAQSYLGFCYYFGKGVGVNKKEAIKWSKLSSDQGNPIGKILLGISYLRAEGVDENKMLGISLLKNAACQGYPLAQYLLGSCYFQGDGVEQNYTLAFNFYYKSAERGNPSGMFNLALCYENGYGTICSRDIARSWYEKAAKKGNQKAIEKLKHYQEESLPFPVEIKMKLSPIPYPEPKESVKRKIRTQFMRVLKDPYYTYFAIINTMICEDSNNLSRLIRASWIPPEINNHLSVKMVIIGKSIECTYSHNGVASSFIQECNTRNIEDVVELTYEIFSKIGLVGYFVSNGAEAINKMNEMKALNDRPDDLPF